MTIVEAVTAVREFGSIEAEGRRLKLRVARGAMSKLAPAIEVLRVQKSAVLAMLGSVEQDEHESPRPTPWAEWKATELNRLFHEQGVAGQPGRITASTVEHGETKGGRTLVRHGSAK